MTALQTSISHTVRCFQHHQRMERVKQAVQLMGKIVESDTFFINKKKSITADYNYLKVVFKNADNFGDELLARKKANILDSSFYNVTKYIGHIDAQISIVNSLKTGHFCLPRFIRDTHPILEIQDLYHIKLPYITQIKNSFRMQKENTMLITGANTSGKSTFMKAAMIAVLLSQTCGIAPCKNIMLTPFCLLYTYLNIPDTVGRESLFEAEMNRCYDYCEAISMIPPNHYSFTIIDELFTGTNPTEGTAGSYAVCEYFAKHPNCVQIVSTHFHYLCKIVDEYPDSFINKMFRVNKKDDGSYKKLYLLEDGISDQNIAVELLAKKGYNDKIIETAQKIIDRLSYKEQIKE